MGRSPLAARPVGGTLAMLVLAAVAAGCFFRVDALDRKVFGFDETATLLREAGATLDDVRGALAREEIRSTADVRDRFQRARPGEGLGATVGALIADDPQHPPLFYLLERAWPGVGTSVAASRGLALLVGLLLLPAAYGFARELDGGTTALVATALVAVSPFHVVFAQIDREYGLWAVLTLLASSALLVALRRAGADARAGAGAGAGARSWVAYAVAVAAGLHTSAFFGYVVLAHAAFVAVRARSLPPRARVAFVAAAAAGIAAFAPWIAVIASRWRIVTSTTEWNAAALPLPLLAAKWAFETGNVFFDAEYARLALAPLAGLVLVLAGIACVAAVRRVPRERVVFLALAIAGNAAPLVLADLALHQSRSTAARYLTPAWLGLELLVASGIAALLTAASTRARALGSVALVALLAAGVASLATSARATFWWADSDDAPLVGVARALDAMRDPTLCYAPPIALLIVGDAVRRPVRFDPVPRSGCLAIADAATIAHVAVRRSRFVEIASTPDGDAALAAAHATVAKAHGVAVDPVRLWQLR